MLIRKLTPAERLLWAQMRFKLWDHLGIDDHLAELEPLIAGGKCWAYVARDSAGDPIGFGELRIRDYANGCINTPVPFLEGIWVDPAHRQTGVGRALLAAISTDLTDAGFCELCSDADIANRRSHMAHEAWGFAETQRVVYFRKPLR